MSEYRFAPFHMPLNALCIWVQQEFLRITEVTGCRCPGTVHPESISLTWSKAGKISVPAQSRHIRQVITDFYAPLVEKTQFDTLRNARKK